MTNAHHRPSDTTITSPSPEDRARLSGPGLRTFLAIADLWGLEEDARGRAIGVEDPVAYHRCCTQARAHLPLTLATAVLRRISTILQIHANSTTLFSDQREAVAWLTKPRSALPFNNRAPIAMIADDDFEALLKVRRFLAGACNGLYMAPVSGEGAIQRLRQQRCGK